MFEAWGRALYTRRRLTLGIALVLVAFAAVWGTGVFGKLSAAGGRDHHPRAAGAGHHAPARPGQLVGAAAAAPAVRQVRDQGRD